MNSWQPLINLISGIPIAALSAWLAVRFALKRFQSEKWFERRLEAYTRVIEALHYMKHCTDRQLRAAQRGYEIPEQDEAELVSTYRKGLADIRRLTDMGALIFSAEAVAILEALNDDLAVTSDEQSGWENLEEEGAAIDKCLLEIRGIAKRDLNA